MLIVYLEPLQVQHTRLLTNWQDWVRFWPRSYAHVELYNAAIPTDWWLLFSNNAVATQWMLQFPEHSRIIRTLFDEHVDENNILR